jgi:hypothetical protein
MDPMKDHANGQCFCGSIKFTVRFPTLWIAHCHCTLCQRAHGAAFVTWVNSDVEKFDLNDPEALLKWYQSGPASERGFCSRCGSSLFFRSSKYPGEVHIARANFMTKLDRKAQIHGFYDTHVGWFEIGDTMPQKKAPRIK